MPAVDGFQATEQIRQLEQSSGLNRTPIVALSARIEEVWKKCQSVGIDGYMGKPFQAEELMEQLKQVID